MAPCRLSSRADAVAVRRLTLTRRCAPCPRCARACPRHSLGRRRLKEIGVAGPIVLEVVYSKHYCPHCAKYFSVAMDYLAPRGGRYTHRVKRAALALRREGSVTLEATCRRLRERYRVAVPLTTLVEWLMEGSEA